MEGAGSHLFQPEASFIPQGVQPQKRRSFTPEKEKAEGGGLTKISFLGRMFPEIRRAG